jgi:Spy/CpxP family protein refolding chaperone
MLKTTLIVLLVLGMIAVAGVAWAKHNGYCSSEDRMQYVSERIGRELDLNDDQKLHLESLIGTLLELRSEQQDRRRGVNQDVTELLSAPMLDRDRAVALIDKRLQGIDDRKRTLVDAFADFSDSLAPEQRAELAELIEQRRMGRWGQHHWEY